MAARAGLDGLIGHGGKPGGGGRAGSPSSLLHGAGAAAAFVSRLQGAALDRQEAALPQVGGPGDGGGGEQDLIRRFHTVMRARKAQASRTHTSSHRKTTHPAGGKYLN